MITEIKFNNGQGERIGKAFANKGENWQWKIYRVEGAIEICSFRSTSLSSGGYYHGPRAAMRSMRSVIKDFAQ